MMGLSPFSLDEEPQSTEEEAPPSSAVAVQDATPAPAEPPKPAIDPVASHIAAKRRELALKTQRLQLDELDWDIPDDKLPRATPGPAGSTPAWDESELEEELAAANAANEASSAPGAGNTPESSTDADLLSDGGDAAGTLLFSADTMNKMRAAAAAQTLEPSQFTADQLAEDVAESPTDRVVPARPADVTPSEGAAVADDRPSNTEATAAGEAGAGAAGEEEAGELLPPPPVSGDSPAVGGASTASGTLIMSANEVSAAAAAAVGMAAADVPELAESAPASSYATKGAGAESTAMPGRAPAGVVGTNAPPAGAPPSAPPPATSPDALVLDSADAQPDTELPRAKEFPVVPVAIGVTVLLLLVAVVLFFLIR